MTKNNKILIYINDNYFHMYFLDNKKEIIKPIKNKFIIAGEIKDVFLGKKFLDELDKKENIYSGFFKPDLTVLYNDITNCDIKALYKMMLDDFNYRNINFVSLSDFLKTRKDYNRIFLYENNTYTSFSERKKYESLDFTNIKPIIIGNDNSDRIHYSDKFLIWNNFILGFTKN